MLLTLLLQVTEGIAQAAPNLPIQKPAEDSLSLFDLMAKGGALMIPIGVLSLISIYMLIERWIAITKLGKSEPALLVQIKGFLNGGQIDAAKNACAMHQSAIARVLSKGVARIGKPIREIESSMEAVAKIEVSKMEKGTGVLGIIAGIAPMFGFIGTISGVIKIFYNISLTDNISIGLISGGLYEKMVTSAAGLVVGVFSFVSYHFLNMLIDRNITRMEVSSVEFIDMLQDPKA